MKHPLVRALLLAAGLAAAVVLAYGRALSGEFQFDDRPCILDNPSVKSLSASVRGFAGGAFSAEARPLTDLTFALDYARAGLDPFTFHATNLLFHLVAVLLAFLLARSLSRRVGDPRPGALAFAAAALWALHPLCTQAVSYVVQRAEVLAAVFLLAAVLLLLRAEEDWPRPRALVSWALALAAFGLGLQSKLVAITTPVAYLAASLTSRPPGTDAGGARPRRVPVPVLLVAPFAAWSAWLAWRFLSGTRHRPDVGFDMPSLSVSSFALTQLRVVLRYATLVPWPAGQNVDHSIVPSRSLGEPGALLAGLGLLALLAGALVALRAGARRRDSAPGRALRLAAFGVLWFFVLVAPSSSVIPIVDLAMEQRAYLASFGLVLAIVALVRAALAPLAARPSAARFAPAAVALGAGAALLATTMVRNEVWHTRVALWKDAAEKSPAKPRPHFNLGQSLSWAGRDGEALAAYTVALGLPEDGTVRFRDFVRNIGGSLIAVGRYDEAASLLADGLEREPYDLSIANNLAVAYLYLGRIAQAEQYARYALRLSPTSAGAHRTLGEAYFRAKRYPEALAEFETGLRLDPDSLPALESHAFTLEELGRRPEACRAWASYGTVRGGEKRTQAAAQRARLGCGP